MVNKKVLIGVFIVIALIIIGISIAFIMMNKGNVKAEYIECCDQTGIDLSSEPLIITENINEGFNAVGQEGYKYAGLVKHGNQTTNYTAWYGINEGYICGDGKAAGGCPATGSFSPNRRGQQPSTVAVYQLSVSQ